MKGIFTLKFRKPGWTEQSKVIIWVRFELQFLYADRCNWLSKFYIIFSTHVIWKFKVLSANFADGNLQLSVGKLKLPAANFFNLPRRRWSAVCPVAVVFRAVSWNISFSSADLRPPRLTNSRPPPNPSGGGETKLKRSQVVWVNYLFTHLSALAVLLCQWSRWIR